MPYHETKIRGKKVYNYLVHTIREGAEWKKVRKYIGEGKLSSEKIRREIEIFRSGLKKRMYLTAHQADEIERVRTEFNEYAKKAGRTGIEKFREWFFTELTYNSNAIEGTSLNLRETSLIINENIVPKNTALREVNEARNHKSALEFLLNHKGDVNEKLILDTHALILANIDDENAGRCRTVPVFILGSDIKLPPPGDVPFLMKRLIAWYKENKSVLHPFELAALFSMKLVSIHPFTDGNGRVSRLMMNYILKKNGYPEINIYVKDRNNYLKSVRLANDEKYEMITDFLYLTLKTNYKFLKE